MWEAIRYVSSAGSLIAFIVAAAVLLFRTRMAKEKELIQTAAESDRAGLVEHLLETFVVDTSSLTKGQKHDLAIRQLDGRMQRYRIAARLVLGLAVLAAALAAFTVTRIPSGGTTPVVYRVRV